MTLICRRTFNAGCCRSKNVNSLMSVLTRDRKHASSKEKQAEAAAHQPAAHTHSAAVLSE